MGTPQNIIDNCAVLTGIQCSGSRRSRFCSFHLIALKQNKSTLIFEPGLHNFKRCFIAMLNSNPIDMTKYKEVNYAKKNNMSATWEG